MIFFCVRGLLQEIVQTRQRFLLHESSCFIRHIRVCISKLVKLTWVHFWKGKIGVSKPPTDYPARRDELYFSEQDDAKFLEPYCASDRDIIDRWTELFFEELYEDQEKLRRVQKKFSEHSKHRELLAKIGKAPKSVKVFQKSIVSLTSKKGESHV